MAKNYKKDVSKRNWSFGLNTALITVVTLSIIGVLNFLSYQHPQKIDLTKNKLNTFSEQTEKVMKELNSPLKATIFGTVESKQRYAAVFDNYKSLSSELSVEWVDPTKELMRTKQAGIKQADTVLLEYKGKTKKVEKISEEAITNAIIKLSRSSSATVCSIQGHGEKSILDAEALGFQSIKKGLEDQGYGVKEFTLSQEAKIPEDCTALVFLGPTKALFQSEFELIDTFLSQGGRMVVAMEAALGQKDETQELTRLLKKWGLDVRNGLIVDLRSRQTGGDASVPINIQYNSGQSITKEFKVPTYFPLTRPVELTSPVPEGLTGNWLSKTSPESWNEVDLSSITQGQVQFNPGSDVQGPITTASAVQGKLKDSKATRETRLVAFGSSQFANNQYSRFGGNLDFFLNAVSWTLEDENLISIRAKEPDATKLEIDPTEITIIFWVSVVFVPLFIAIAGIIIWIRRKKL